MLSMLPSMSTGRCSSKSFSLGVDHALDNHGTSSACLVSILNFRRHPPGCAFMEEQETSWSCSSQKVQVSFRLRILALEAAHGAYHLEALWRFLQMPLDLSYGTPHRHLSPRRLYNWFSNSSSSAKIRQSRDWVMHLTWNWNATSPSLPPSSPW
jgi:hypothetical protein